MARSPLTKPEGRPGARPPGLTIEMKERRLPAGDGARFVLSLGADRRATSQLQQS